MMSSNRRERRWIRRVAYLRLARVADLAGLALPLSLSLKPATTQERKATAMAALFSVSLAGMATEGAVLAILDGMEMADTVAARVGVTSEEDGGIMMIGDGHDGGDGGEVD